MPLGRLLLVIGLSVAALGALVMLAQSLGFGRLPGDIVLKKKGLTVYIPLLSSLVLSVLATLLINLFRK
jgi:hypothetical protein